MSILWLNEYWKILLPIFVYCALIYAVFTDIKYRLIPNWISIIVIATFIGYYFISNNHSLGPSNFLVSFLVLVVLLPLFAFNKMGAGDIKLVSALSLWMGPDNVIDFLSVTALTGGAIAVLYLARSYAAICFAFIPIYGNKLAKLCLVGPQTVPYALPIVFSAYYFMFQHFGGLG